jgi:hypothetical protein
MADAEVDAVDFEPKEDDLMGDDMAMDDGNADVVFTPAPKLKSTITGGTSCLDDGGPNKTKGRGFRKEIDVERNNLFRVFKDFSLVQSVSLKSLSVRKWSLGAPRDIFQSKELFNCETTLLFSRYTINILGGED